ncbi:MarR family transcriptional regulator [Paractinoplanes abujensis]|uniref:DNA-binding MarR family transcriptional regulator n=1 Tax=Paractinoplanes abujensis TaxID=882441 RepID=A0A7W7G257_9ACTN|nr:MarR family winged helix-turn-helix transcriptional regulator [Actinoplanes abujensis]MBB4692815.1 DNA-binding MarR family transcriptional regulator [Actinoplanes abujensis]GID22686.1 MarR family transcriptional regulator [Actinoplanes abujensis]
MAEVPGPPASSQLLIGLARLGQAVRMEAWRNAGPHNLSPLQADIVTLLQGKAQPIRQGEIVAALASTPPTVSDAVKVLRKKELLEASRDPGDARALLLGLTEAGRAEAERLRGESEVLSGAVAALSREDFAAMLRGTATLMLQLQDRKAIPISQMCLTCRFFAPRAHPEDPARPHHCNFVDAPFGDAELRVTCPDHEAKDL